MVKSVICITASVFFLVIETCILILKPNFGYAFNDKDNYCVYYQKWIRSVVFMTTIILSLICIYFSVNFNHFIGFSLLSIECLLVIIYALVKFKGITINGENIKVQRLFAKDIDTTFEGITKVVYLPNAKMIISLKKKVSFEVSFNSVNFYKFYIALIEHDVKFKTGRVPNDQSYVILNRFNIIINFPKTMFREYYELNTYFRNSKYLFSARGLDNKEHIEGYTKESGKAEEEFMELVKNDLQVNNFNVVDHDPVTIEDINFTVIKALDKKHKDMARLAYILRDENDYLVLYLDYLLENEDDFVQKIHSAIRRPNMLDSHNKIAEI